MLKLIWTVQVPSVHSLEMNQAMAALMTLSWQFKELQALLVKFITSFLHCRELISFLVCKYPVTAMNFVTYVT